MKLCKTKIVNVRIQKKMEIKDFSFSAAKDRYGVGRLKMRWIECECSF